MDIVDAWIEEFKNDHINITVDEVQEAIDEIVGIISNNRVFLKGCIGEDIEIMERNIDELQQYLEWLNGLKYELMNE